MAHEKAGLFSPTELVELYEKYLSLKRKGKLKMKYSKDFFWYGGKVSEIRLFLWWLNDSQKKTKEKKK